MFPMTVKAFAPPGELAPVYAHLLPTGGTIFGRLAVHDGHRRLGLLAAGGYGTS